MKRILLSSLFVTSLYAGDEIPTLEENKANLSPNLQIFLNDFATWSKEDRNKIDTYVWAFTTDRVAPAKQAKYGGHLGLWLANQIENQEKKSCICKLFRPS